MNKKQLIRLTESQFHQIVKETVNELLNEERYTFNCYIPGKGNITRTAEELKALKPYIEQATYWDITTGWNSSEVENLVAWGGEGGYWDNYSKNPHKRDTQLVLSKKKD